MTFTEKYFHEEVNRFRQAMGEKTWWEHSEEQRDAYLSGLFLVYLNIENEDKSPVTPEQIEKWFTTFEAVSIEYEHRKTYITLRPEKV